LVTLEALRCIFMMQFLSKKHLNTFLFDMNKELRMQLMAIQEPQENLELH
jgi:hypothetical protein